MKFYLLGYITLAFPFALHAQNDLPSFETTVVTGIRKSEITTSVIPSLTVVTKQDIQKIAPASLVDILQSQIGTEVTRNGGIGTTATIFMRGQASNNIAIFVDGVRVFTDQYGGVQIPDIPPNLIERIEILRGNSSALFGEAAVGGSIHIFTKKVQPQQVDLSSQIGSRNTYELSAGYSYSSPANSWNISVNRYETDGFSAMRVSQNPQANPDNDRFQRSAVLLNGAIDASEDVKFGIQLIGNQSKAAYDSAYDGADAIHQGNTTNAQFTSFGTWKIHPNWSSTLSLSAGFFQLRDYLNHSSTGKSKGNHTNLTWRNVWKIQNNDIIQLNIESRDESFTMEKSTWGYDHKTYDRKNYASSLGYMGNIGNWEYQGSVRYDQVKALSASHRISNTFTSYLLGLGYWVTDDLKLVGLSSTSFRAPNTAELFGDIWGTQGNPALVPEDHKGYEIGIEYQGFLGNARLIYFQTKTNNAIIYDSNSFKNIGSSENNGVEMSWSHSYQGWSYVWNTVYQNPMNTSDDQRLARRARAYGSIAVGKEWLGIDWFTSMRWSTNRVDRLDKEYRLGGYQVFDVSASKEVAPHWTARLKIDNLLDKDYQSAFGYNTPPRGIFFTLHYQP